MNRILIYITLTVWAFFVAMTPSCTSEEIQQEEPPVTFDEDPFKDGELPINLPVTRAVNDENPENKVTKARLIVIKNSIVTNNKIFDNIYSVGTHDTAYVLDTVPVGKVDMFIIVNEKSEWGLDAIAKKSVCPPRVIEEKTLSFSAYPIVDATHPIPMYKQYRDLSVSSSGTFTQSDGTSILMPQLGEVERLYAKVTFVISAKFEDMVNGGDAIKLDSVSIKSIPRHSYLTPSVGLLYPASGGYFNGADSAQTSNYVADAVGLRDSIVWYIPEHRLSDTTYMTYISVKASLEDNILPSEQVEFKRIILGDGANVFHQDSLRKGKNDDKDLPLNNWFITRNTHYKVNAVITSFDKANESKMEIITKIISWEQVPIDDTDIWRYELKISPQDRFYIPATGDFEGTVRVETNYPGGWNVPSSTGMSYSNGSAVYGTNLINQTGTLLRFKYTGTGNGSLNVVAGYIVKRIELIRN
jgi:hypothetical protein